MLSLILVSTSTFADFSCLNPFPFIKGLGSFIGHTTLLIPDFIIASVQGGDILWKLWGSKVQYSVPPRVLTPALLMALTSAWFPGLGSVTPSPTIFPLLTITAPTRGRGETNPEFLSAILI